MPISDLVRTVDIERSPRVLQLEGLFEIPPAAKSETRWKVSLPVEDRDWSIGLIVGPSGSGKSTVARELFGEHIVAGHEWSPTAAVVDGFPKEMSIKEITGLLSSVGFSSPPAWLRPFAMLSNGEQFRVTLARALAESKGTVAVDEFTSVVDRTVAQIGSAAVAKAVRRRKTKFVAISCHYDVEKWLDPDWVYEPAVDSFRWRALQGRPAVDLEIGRVRKQAWVYFKRHHYLNSTLARGARCFGAWYQGRLVAFASVIPFPHAVRPGWREHRTVCLPDFQGVGIGNALSEFVGSIYRSSGKPYFSTTGNPAMIRHRAHSPLWKMNRKPGRTAAQGRSSSLQAMRVSSNRFTAGFEYVGPARPAEGWGLGF